MISHHGASLQETSEHYHRALLLPLTTPIHPFPDQQAKGTTTVRLQFHVPIIAL
jgi:hypothetical protein